MNPLTRNESTSEGQGIHGAHQEQYTRGCLPLERPHIHAGQMERTDVHYAVPLADRGGTLSEHFGEVPYSALVTVRLADAQVEDRQVLASPHQEERAKGIRVAEWLTAGKAGVVLAKQSLRGEGPVYVFGDAGVRMRGTGVGALEEAIATQLAKGEKDR